MLETGRRMITIPNHYHIMKECEASERHYSNENGGLWNGQDMPSTCGVLAFVLEMDGVDTRVNVRLGGWCFGKWNRGVLKFRDPNSTCV